MPGSSAEARRGTGTRNGRVALVIAGVVLLAMCVYRASLGISFFDEGHYAAITLHLAQGTRPFADEMTTQVLGFLLALLPVAAESIRKRDTRSLQSLALTAPLGIIGYVVVA